MINFQLYDPGLMQIAALASQRGDLSSTLPNTLYVFGANDNRSALIYISPYIANALVLGKFLEQKLGIEVRVEFIGSPPQKNWVAFHKKLRDNSPAMCCKVCLFVERAVNNLITW